jgi:Outer membrane protein beta-barrel domain
MEIRSIRYGILLTVVVVAWTAAPAQAQWVVTPYIGVNLSGTAESRKGGFGGSISYFGGPLGFEFEAQRYYHFFKDAEVASLVPRGADLDTDARSFMGNLVAPFHIQHAPNWRLYGVAGLGVIRAVFETAYPLADTDQNNFGFNVGGGAMYSLNSRVGLRSDVRYFRALVDEDKHEGGFFKDYDFWRATFGVTFGFPQ